MNWRKIFGVIADVFIWVRGQGWVSRQQGVNHEWTTKKKPKP